MFPFSDEYENSSPSSTERVVLEAFKNGYRHVSIFSSIDSLRLYGVYEY